MEAFKEKVERLFQKHEELITRKNVAVERRAVAYSHVINIRKCVIGCS